MMAERTRRQLRESPYVAEHLASAQRTEPVTFADLLRWFLEGFAAETPERLHAAGVWFGPPAKGVESELVGGSQLGAPKQAGAMRQLLENSPRQVYDHDTADARYARPMRAALARLAGHDGQAPFMARFLVQVAYSQGDVRSVGERWFAVLDAQVFAYAALKRLYANYRDEPPARILPTWVDLSDAQRHAIEDAEGKGAT